LRFSGLILENYLNGIFGLLKLGNGQKRDKKKIEGKRRQEKSFFSQLRSSTRGLGGGLGRVQ
jgi:hypothetical protein